MPIVAKSWELQGFYCDIELCGFDSAAQDRVEFLSRFFNLENTRLTSSPDRISANEGTGPTLIAQVIRMYTTFRRYTGDQYCLLSDADMFVASNFLYRDFHRVNVFGHDLTNFGHIPICYVGAPACEWSEIMNANGEAGTIEDDIARYCRLETEHGRWVCDQDIITNKLRDYGFERINFVSRGRDRRNRNLPLGRWDRFGGFKRPRGAIHDVHLPRDPMSPRAFGAIVEMCRRVYPHADWSWLHAYREAFAYQLAQQPPELSAGAPGSRRP